MSRKLGRRASFAVALFRGLLVLRLRLRAVQLVEHVREVLRSATFRYVALHLGRHHVEFFRRELRALPRLAVELVVLRLDGVVGRLAHLLTATFLASVGFVRCAVLTSSLLTSYTVRFSRCVSR